MVLRNIVKIDEEKCNGCGQCVDACAEGAIRLVDGKAKLVSETYCDGLGACIGHCPQDAITIEQREAAEFDEQAAKKHPAEQKAQAASGFVCPGLAPRQMPRPAAGTSAAGTPSQLGQWPIQLRLVAPNAPYFKNADLLVAADCVPFAMGDFHDRLLKGKNIVVGCPKLDDRRLYIDKLAALIKANALHSLTVVHMEVACCFGLVAIVRAAIAESGVEMDFEDVTVALDGTVSKTATTGE